MTGLPGVFRSAFLRGNGAVSAPRVGICAWASVFRGFGAASAAGRLPVGRCSGKRRSGGAQWLALGLRLAVPPRPLALPLQALALVPHPLALILEQVQPEPMDVEGDDREADRQLEPVRSAQPNLVQASLLQIVDHRFHPGMLPARRREGRLRVALAPAFDRRCPA